MPKFLIYAGLKNRASYQYTIECKSKEEALKIACEEAKRQYQLNSLATVIPKEDELEYYVSSVYQAKE